MASRRNEFSHSSLPRSLIRVRAKVRQQATSHGREEETEGLMGAVTSMKPGSQWQNGGQIQSSGPGLGLPYQANAFMVYFFTTKKLICDFSPQGPHVLRDFHLPNNYIYQGIIYSFSHFLN